MTTERGHGEGEGEGGDAQPEAEEGDRHQRRRHEAPPAGDLDAELGEAEQGREQRGGRQHRHGDGERGADAETGHELQADEQQTEQRHHDRDAGEDDGPSGGVHRRHRGRGRRPPAMQTLSISGHDEQGVVDPDAQADHRSDRGGEVGHGGDVADQVGQPQPEAHPAQGHGDRQAHGQHRPERHDEDHHGERDADELRLRWLEAGEGLAADLDAQTVDVRFDALGAVDQLGPEVAGLGEGEAVGQLELGVGDLAGVGTVGGHQTLALPDVAVGADHRDAGRLRGELEELLDGVLDGRVVDALFSLEDDAPGLAGAEPTEAGIEHLEAGAALRGGCLRIAAEVGSDDVDQAPHDDDEEHPCRHHHPPVVEAPASDPHVHRSSSRVRACGKLRGGPRGTAQLRHVTSGRTQQGRARSGQGPIRSGPIRR